MADEGRSWVSGYYQLNIDGMKCGMIKKASGGHWKADVVSEAVSGGYLVKKHLGNRTYEDISFDMVGVDANPMREWLQASLDANYMRKNGSIVAADFKRDARTEKQFMNALITEIGFPDCDAASKDAALLSVKLAPEIVRHVKGSGKVEDLSNAKQKLWLKSNFSLKIDGLDKVTARASKIDKIVWKQKVTRDQYGEVLDYPVEPGAIEMPNLKVTVPDQWADPVRQWMENFLIKGVNDESQEKSGELIYKTPDLTKDVMSIQFYNLGIFSLTESDNEDMSDKLKTVTFEMYCEKMTAKWV